MKSVMIIYKPIARTPLETLELFRAQYSEYSTSILGYAGRLDPMAEGLLLVLIGEENKNRKAYEGLDKHYDIEVLFGISTDTYDGMGIASEVIDPNVVNITAVAQSANTLAGEHIQPYPPYSSARIDGKPLYYYARRGLLDTVTIPEAVRVIHSITNTGSYLISHEDLWQRLEHAISQVNGNFRQTDILARWQRVLAAPYQFPVCKFTVACSGGTYMRSIAHELGKIAHTGAFALSIVRTKIGPYTMKDALILK